MRLFEGRFFMRGWLQFVTSYTDVRSVGVSFRGRDLPQALAIKETVEDFISRRQVVPYLRTLQP